MCSPSPNVPPPQKKRDNLWNGFEWFEISTFRKRAKEPWGNDNNILVHVRVIPYIIYMCVLNIYIVTRKLAPESLKHYNNVIYTSQTSPLRSTNYSFHGVLCSNLKIKKKLPPRDSFPPTTTIIIIILLQISSLRSVLHASKSRRKSEKKKRIFSEEYRAKRWENTEHGCLVCEHIFSAIVSANHKLVAVISITYLCIQQDMV